MKNKALLLITFLLLACQTPNQTQENRVQKERFYISSNTTTTNQYKELSQAIKKNTIKLADQKGQIKILTQNQNAMIREIERLKSNADSLITPPQTNSYPTPITPNTIDWSAEPYTLPNENNAAPAYLIPFTDTETGAEIVRIADPSVMGGTGQELGINYPSNAVWNSNSSLIKLNKNGSIGAHILNANNYAVEYICNNIPSWSQWSYLQPTKMYGTTNNNQWCIFDVTTDTKTVQFTFSNYSSVSISSGEGRQDRYDKFVCMVGIRNGTPNSNKWLIIYDIQQQSIHAELDLGAGGDLDNAAISPLGNYVVVNWRNNGSGAKEGYKIYDNDFTNLKHAWDDTEHGDLGIDINGDEVLVAFAGSSRPDGYSLTMIKLSTGVRYGLWHDISTNPTGGIWGGFISCTNWKRDGWAYVSVDLTSSNTFNNQLVAVKLVYDNSNIIELYGSNHTNRITANHAVKGVASPNGTKIAFNSNWNNTTLKGYNHAPAFVLTWPQN